jgi:hypothetical protein
MVFFLYFGRTAFSLSPEQQKSSFCRRWLEKDMEGARRVFSHTDGFCSSGSGAESAQLSRTARRRMFALLFNQNLPVGGELTAQRGKLGSDRPPKL